MATLMTIEEPARAARAQPAWALWQLGFRPFYLLASIFAALSVPLWALQYAGWIDHAYLRGPLWHAHEMLFGYALAVIVGFLFTAGRNWSGQPTPSGRALQALALLWLAGRVLVLTPWATAAALVNVAFPLAAALGLARALVAAGNRRNYFFIGLLVLLAAAQALVHAGQLHWLDLPGAPGLPAGLDLVLLIMTVMAGRVVPMFTNNGVPGAAARRNVWIERTAVGGVVALLLIDALGRALGPWQTDLSGLLARDTAALQGAQRGAWLPGLVLLAVLVVATVAHAARLLLWQPWTTGRNPLVWILHAAYAWIPLHLALRAATALGWVAAAPATHALTAGAIGALTIGMMTRTARGHTARPLRADRYDIVCYSAVLAGAAVRVVVPLVWPAAQVHAVLGSALLWSAGFALYAWHYAPWLCRARPDGRPG